MVLIGFYDEIKDFFSVNFPQKFVVIFWIDFNVKPIYREFSIRQYS